MTMANDQPEIFVLLTNINSHSIFQLITLIYYVNYYNSINNIFKVSIFTSKPS